MVDVKELRNHSNVTFEYVLVFFIISITAIHGAHKTTSSQIKHTIGKKIKI